jgi:hypothetical protein
VYLTDVWLYSLHLLLANHPFFWKLKQPSLILRPVSGAQRGRWQCSKGTVLSSICLLYRESLLAKMVYSLSYLRLISWWITLLECRKSSPLRTCFVTQIISNSLIGPLLSNFSRTDPPSPASIKRWTVSPHRTAPYNSAMFSCRKQAWISTSDGLNWSTGI